MKRPIHVWHLSNQPGYAGTERAMAAWVKELKAPFAGQAFYRSRGLPPFGRRPCDILHLHRHGEADAGWDEAVAKARAAGVRVIVETNVFGARDHSGMGRSLDHHFFVSAMCLWRYAGWPKALPAETFQKHSVLYNPLLSTDFPARAKDSTRRARRALGLPEEGFYCGRLGRPDPNKWPAWLMGAFVRLAQRRPEARLLLMQAPDFVKGQAEELGLKDRVHFLQASPDWRRVRLAYQALDCLAHGSRVGESFGYTLAEAQAFGMPVVVDSTPWADNAQVEVVEHGVTGLVAGRPAAFSAALGKLASDPKLRARLGAAGRRSALSRYSVGALARGLEKTYSALLAGKILPEQDWVKSFGPGYRARLRRREDPSALRDAAWGAYSSISLHWRGLASRTLKRLGLKR